ncbi:hypothetical protein M426DRAFT_115928 [Hypoxylon sp. CI-4A]|nr:hypothetical protein M426DRAFT_115928 [Hypoxylon sp. CI-4A]
MVSLPYKRDFQQLPSSNGELLAIWQWQTHLLHLHCASQASSATSQHSILVIGYNKGQRVSPTIRCICGLKGTV